VSAPPHTRHCRAELEDVLEGALSDREERENNVREDAARSVLRSEQELSADYVYKKLRQTQSEHTAKFKVFIDLLNHWKTDDRSFPRLSSKTKLWRPKREDCCQDVGANRQRMGRFP